MKRNYFIFQKEKPAEIPKETEQKTAEQGQTNTEQTTTPATNSSGVLPNSSSGNSVSIGANSFLPSGYSVPPMNPGSSESVSAGSSSNTGNSSSFGGNSFIKINNPLNINSRNTNFKLLPSAYSVSRQINKNTSNI